MKSKGCELTSTTTTAAKLLSMRSSSDGWPKERKIIKRRRGDEAKILDAVGRAPTHRKLNKWCVVERAAGKREEFHQIYITPLYFGLVGILPFSLAAIYGPL